MRFYPLESNPDTINIYLNKLGLKSNYGVNDVIGFTEDLIPFVIKPIYAVIFLYPVDGSIQGEKILEDFSLLNETEEEKNKKDTELSEDLFFMKQTIGNACGTVALIHAIANNLNDLEFEEGSIIKRYIEGAKDKSPIDKSLYLETFNDFAKCHEACASSSENQTEIDENTTLHFVALVEHKGYLWKCDGRKDKKPIRVNTATKDTVFESAAQYALKFMENNPKILTFSALTLNKF